MGLGGFSGFWRRGGKGWKIVRCVDTTHSAICSSKGSGRERRCSSSGVCHRGADNYGPRADEALSLDPAVETEDGAGVTGAEGTCMASAVHDG